jgi:hypothetical protein
VSWMNFLMSPRKKYFTPSTLRTEIITNDAAFRRPLRVYLPLIRTPHKSFIPVTNSTVR